MQNYANIKTGSLQKKKKKKAVRLCKKLRFYPIFSGKTKEDLSNRMTGSDSLKTGVGKLCSMILVQFV